MEKRSLLNIPHFRTVVWTLLYARIFYQKINFPIMHYFEFLEYVDGISRNLKNGMKKAVATYWLIEREHSLIKLVLWWMLASYTLQLNTTKHDYCNLQTTLAIHPCTGKSVECKILWPRDKKRPTKWVRPSSQRGKDERRKGWKKKHSKYNIPQWVFWLLYVQQSWEPSLQQNIFFNESARLLKIKHVVSPLLICHLW